MVDSYQRACEHAAFGLVGWDQGSALYPPSLSSGDNVTLPECLPVSQLHPHPQHTPKPVGIRE